MMSNESSQPLYSNSDPVAHTTGTEFRNSFSTEDGGGTQSHSLPEDSRGHNVRRKPVPSHRTQEQPYADYDFTPLKTSSASRNSSSAPYKIHWLTPATAVGLFLLGLGASLGHHFFLHALNDKKLHDQVWINRYSLALAFVVKASLAAAIAVAYAQKLWHSLDRLPTGVTVSGIDALFTILESPLQFKVWDFWRSTPVAAVMAVAVWLMPLSALVSPTALTVGTLTQNSTNANCEVPTINMSNQPLYTQSTALTLSTAEHTGNIFGASMVAQRIVGLTLRNGRQSDWSSPCGANCSYEVTFVAPAWQCQRTDDIDNPDAPWRSADWNTAEGGLLLPASYWWSDYGDGSNVTAESAYSALEYGPVYAGGLNNNTAEFWAGVSGSPGTSWTKTETVQDFLDMHVYSCGFFNASYHVQVNYVNDHQFNKVLSVSMIQKYHPHAGVWESYGECRDKGDGNDVCNDRAQLDAISLYRTMIPTLMGSINRSPEGQVLDGDSTIALVPTLVQKYSVQHEYGTSELLYPYKNLGPLLEELSHNISISLMSEPGLQTTTTVITTCNTSLTLAVWKYRPVALVVAYACAVAATMLALGVGAHALLSGGVARDKSFSTIVRATRSRDLNCLSPGSEVAGLPLAKDVAKIRLKFGQLATAGSKNPNKPSTIKLGFHLASGVEMRPLAS